MFTRGVGPIYWLWAWPVCCIASPTVYTFFLLQWSLLLGAGLCAYEAALRDSPPRLVRSLLSPVLASFFFNPSLWACVCCQFGLRTLLACPQSCFFAVLQRCAVPCVCVCAQLLGVPMRDAAWVAAGWQLPRR